MNNLAEMEAEIARLNDENNLLRRTIELHKRQVLSGGMNEENRRLRAKIAEWEGWMRPINGGYYHGARFIRPYQDEAPAS